MPQQVITSVENNFTKGLITEATGLNFPENACTSCNNCEFTLVGDVIRREGIDIEVNGVGLITDRTNRSVNTYIWNNVAGDGNTRFLVSQIGAVLYFYNISLASTGSPVSNQRLAATVPLPNYVVVGNTLDITIECQFTDGNGYLFVFHPDCEPLYVTYNPIGAVITANIIPLTIRDFAGIRDNLSTSTRPAVQTPEHQYNLQNQGWISGQPWQATSTTPYSYGTPGTVSFTVASGITGIVAGQIATLTYNGPFIPSFPPPGSVVGSGTVSSYSGTTLTLNLTSVTNIPNIIGASSGPWGITPVSVGFINTFLSAASVYPSNADVWWFFKDSTGAFSPSTTLANTSYTTGNAPNGHYILPAFGQDRASTAGITGLTPVSTLTRPSTGAWFQGRVFYSGVNASFPSSGDAFSYSWTENIYFSQVVQSNQDFGNCYQVNDPTSQNLNSILPTDGGVITIVGCGTIYKLFSIANGLLVFAANGVWFITGSQGIGFTADDYTVTKISSVQCISGTSFVDVLGLPYFWNEEGIYKVMTTQNSGSLTVEPITVGTILTFYSNIPRTSKRYVHGAYDPINYVIQWVYRSTLEPDVTGRYSYDQILNYNVYNHAFYPYNISNTPAASINGISYVASPSGAFEPGFKYIVSTLQGGVFNLSLGDEHSTSYADWVTYLAPSPSYYVSTFTTGYKLHGQGIAKTQVPYIYIYSRNNNVPTYYYVQGIWDYATNSNSGKWTTNQYVENNSANFNMIKKRHRVRGRGQVLQLQVTSVLGKPFDIMGWALHETINTGV